MGLRDTVLNGSRSIASRLSAVFTGREIDEDVLEEAEEALLTSDMGWELTERIISDLPSVMRSEGLSWREAIAELIMTHCPVPSPALEEPSARPEVTLFVGVNGSGKTTTIARLARLYTDRGQRVLMACADTFRAAAAEQLSAWGEKLSIETITQLPGADPAAVAFDAIKRGISRDFDRILVDTAGRLPTRDGLMRELGKINRVCSRALEGAPHRILLVVDGTVGQNALPQAESFMAALPVSGLVVTKMDGTAGGGSILAMSCATSLPVLFVGIGESSTDIAEFDQRPFVDSLLGIAPLKQ